jgi:hypothetical protein
VKISEIADRTGRKLLSPCEDGDVAGAYVSGMASDVIAGARAGARLDTITADAIIDEPEGMHAR